jgi:hypothetical protein
MLQTLFSPQNLWGSSLSVVGTDVTGVTGFVGITSFDRQISYYHSEMSMRCMSNSEDVDWLEREECQEKLRYIKLHASGIQMREHHPRAEVSGLR